MTNSLALEYIDYIRTSMDQAGVNVGLYSRNTKAHLANSFALIKSDVEAESLAETVLLLAGKFEVARTEMRESEAVAIGKLLIENLNRLQIAIGKCPPSKRARNLSL